MIPELVVYYLLTFAGFTESQAHVMTCVAKYESSFRPAALNTNTNGTLDVGLLQINTVWHNTSPECAIDKLQNPMYNSLCAYKVFNEQGISAWVAWSLNKEECNTYKVKGVE